MFIARVKADLFSQLNTTVIVHRLPSTLVLIVKSKIVINQLMCYFFVKIAVFANKFLMKNLNS